jgi:hypothetical protein
MSVTMIIGIAVLALAAVAVVAVFVIATVGANKKGGS